MTNVSLAQSYLIKATKRLKILEMLLEELTFYGDIDFIPTDEYTSSDARRAIRDVEFTVKVAKRIIPFPESEE